MFLVIKFKVFRLQSCFRSLRKRRTVRGGRSADVGVSGIYEVVSEADLAFGPSRESVTVFSGRIREEVS